MVFSPEDDVPLFLYDSDGMLIDTDLPGADTAKGKETRAIMQMHGIVLSPEEFAAFYRDFNEKSAGTSLRSASTLLCKMLNSQFGAGIADPSKFYESRLTERTVTYETRARFISDGQKDNGNWLEALPDSIKQRHYIVTNSNGSHILGLNRNPNIRIDGDSLLHHFGNRVVYREMVRDKKPSPEGYDLALCSARPAVNGSGIVGIAFEDSFSGIRAAKRASYREGKLFVVGVGSSRTEVELREQGADHFAPALHAIDLDKLLHAAGYRT